MPDRKITEYHQTSGQNVTSDIREGNFFESDIRPDSEKMSSKKEAYRRKNCNLTTMYKIMHHKYAYF